MPKHIRKSDGSGQLAGSIGDGKNRLVPTASRVPKIVESLNTENKLEIVPLHAPLEYYLRSWIQSPDAEAMVASFEYPEWAAGMCESASGSFGTYLLERGEVIQVLELKHIATGAPHAVTLVGGDIVVDWTLRQFDENADVPTVSNIKDLEKDFIVLSYNEPEYEGEEDFL